MCYVEPNQNCIQSAIACLCIRARYCLQSAMRKGCTIVVACLVFLMQCLLRIIYDLVSQMNKDELSLKSHQGLLLKPELLIPNSIREDPEAPWS